MELQEALQEIERLKGQLAFERKQHDKRLNNIMQDCQDSLHNSIMLEVEGIKDVLQQIDNSRACEKIARRLSKIEKRLRG